MKRNLIVLATLISIFSLFLIMSLFEYNDTIAESRIQIEGDQKVLSEKISRILNYSLGVSQGIISYIRSYPELTQSDFSAYVEKVINDDHNVISHYVAIKDTTIAFSYPLSGNESGIGIDLATIEDQSEQVLYVKEERKSLLVGPVDLVEGGRRLINRLPIVINPDDPSTYWGQLSVIIRYESLLLDAGIDDLVDGYYIEIRQVNQLDDQGHIVLESLKDLTDDAVFTTFEVPNGYWKIGMESKDKFQGSFAYYSILLVGFVASLGAAYAVRYILMMNENLNNIVELRTERIQSVNKKLYQSLDQLRATQKQLVEKEKQAALGGLVSGVAHEINTPIGVSITTLTFIQDKISEIQEELNSNALKKSTLTHNLSKTNEAISLISENLNRTSKLIENFKMISSDLITDTVNEINLKEYINYIVTNIVPKYNTQYDFVVDIPESLLINTFPGALFQVFSNLIVNSIEHGFKDGGQIKISGKSQEGFLEMDYYDNGKGIDEIIKEEVFLPFYTTKRSQGNTGLGLHIVYNMITQKLGGSIEIINDTDQGVHFKIIITS